ncbi:hypothetical protein GCM10010388_64290 [Streptomyces mauvecolor]
MKALPHPFAINPDVCVRGVSELRVGGMCNTGLNTVVMCSDLRKCLQVRASERSPDPPWEADAGIVRAALSERGLWAAPLIDDDDRGVPAPGAAGPIGVRPRLRTASEFPVPCIR